VRLRNVRFTPKADITECDWNVRFVPKADIDGLFDHLVRVSPKYLKGNWVAHALTAQADQPAGQRSVELELLWRRRDCLSGRQNSVQQEGRLLAWTKRPRHSVCVTNEPKVRGSGEQSLRLTAENE
jgi:hypothetical protein